MTIEKWIWTRMWNYNNSCYILCYTANYPKHISEHHQRSVHPNFRKPNRSLSAKSCPMALCCCSWSRISIDILIVSSISFLYCMYNVLWCWNLELSRNQEGSGLECFAAIHIKALFVITRQLTCTLESTYCQENKHTVQYVQYSYAWVIFFMKQDHKL